MRLATLTIDGSATAAVLVNDHFVRLPATDVGALLRLPVQPASSAATSRRLGHSLRDGGEGCVSKGFSAA